MTDEVIDNEEVQELLAWLEKCTLAELLKAKEYIENNRESFSMNKFDELKAKIRSQYPMMNWKQRLFSSGSRDCEYRIMVEGGYAQAAILRRYKGKEYTVRFGTFK